MTAVRRRGWASNIKRTKRRKEAAVGDSFIDGDEAEGAGGIPGTGTFSLSRISAV